VTAAAPTKIVVSGFPAVTAGIAASVTVTVTDSYGNTTPGYTGTVHFTSSDAKAVLPADYTFTAADAGQHIFTGVTLKTAGTQSLSARDTVSTAIAGSETGIAVSPAATSQLRVTTSASKVTAGNALSVTVTAIDPYGNVTPAYTGTAHFTSTDLQAVLPADYTFQASDKGSHTFSVGLTLKTVGAEKVTATDTATGSITGTSAAVTVGAAALDHLAISTSVTSTPAGKALTVTVSPRDAYGNVLTSGYTGTVQLSSSDGQAVLPAAYTFTGGGTHTFTVTLKTAGSQTVTATDAAHGLNATATVSVSAAAAAKLLIALPTTAVHGSPASVTVTLVDAYGNVATGYTGTVHFSSSDTNAVLPANYTFTSGDAGQHTFAVTFDTTGLQSLTVKDTLSAGLTSTQKTQVS
jgi:hypothetical protein